RKPSMTRHKSSGKSAHTSSGARADSRISSTNCWMRDSSDMLLLCRLVQIRCGPQIADRSGQKRQTPDEAPLHRLGGNAQHVGGFGLAHSLDSHEVEHFALVLRKILDRVENAAGVGT